MMDRSNINLALTIAGLVEALSSEKETQWMNLESYQNGREQGLAINSFIPDVQEGTGHRYASFSENRNSNDIVVYTSKINPMQSITEEMYKSAKYFSSNEIQKAAEYIHTFLTKE